jgi:malonate transporter and related proteins
MNHIVLSALLPVMALILLGLGVGRARWLGPVTLRRLTDLAFLVLTPVLLFRAMSRVHVELLDLRPAAVYTLALVLVFAGMLRQHGLSQRGAVLALAATYGNAVMIGIPLVSLAWGEAGLVTLFTLIPIHSLVLLTTATVVLEFALAREQAAATPDVAARLWMVGLRSLRKALLHPVPLPILAGLLFAQTGWQIPPWLDLPMAWLGKGFGPLALFLVGVSLASSYVGRNLRGAMRMTAVKALLLPSLAGALGWAFGMSGLPLAVMVVTAGLPVGANAFLFSQRYGVAQETVTASVAVSTAVTALTVSLILLFFGAG